MKFRKWLAVIACVAAALGVLSRPKAGWAQDDELRPLLTQPQPSPSANPFQRAETRVPDWSSRTVVQPGSMQGIELAAKELHDAKAEDAKVKAQQKLSELLDTYFEEDMKRRAEELAKIEERVKTLRALMEKRATKKQEIIQLQIKVLENEADGLGFFSNSPRPGQVGDWIALPPSTAAPTPFDGGTIFVTPPGTLPGVGVGGGDFGGRGEVNSRGGTFSNATGTVRQMESPPSLRAVNSPPATPPEAEPLFGSPQ